MTFITRYVFTAAFLILSNTGHGSKIDSGPGWESITFNGPELNHFYGNQHPDPNCWVGVHRAGDSPWFSYGPYARFEGHGDLQVSAYVWLHGKREGIKDEDIVAQWDMNSFEGAINFGDLPTSVYKKDIRGKDDQNPESYWYDYNTQFSQPLWTFNNLHNPKGLEFRIYNVHPNMIAHICGLKFTWLYR